MDSAITAAIIVAAGGIVAAIVGVFVSTIIKQTRKKKEKDQESFVFPSKTIDPRFDEQLVKLLQAATNVRLCGWSLIRIIREFRHQLGEAKSRGCEFRILLLDPDSMTVRILDNLISETNPIKRKSKGWPPILPSEITKNHLIQVIKILLENEIISSDTQEMPLHLCKTLLPFGMIMIECKDGSCWFSVQVYPLHPDLPVDRRLQFRSTTPKSRLWLTLREQFDVAWEDPTLSRPYSV